MRHLFRCHYEAAKEFNDETFYLAPGHQHSPGIIRNCGNLLRATGANKRDRSERSKNIAQPCCSATSLRSRKSGLMITSLLTHPAMFAKAERLAKVKSGATTLDSINEEENVTMRVYQNSAVTTSCVTLKGQYSGQPISGEYRSTLVWVKGSGRLAIGLESINSS